MDDRTGGVRRRRFLAAGVAGAALLAGCTGGDDDAPRGADGANGDASADGDLPGADGEVPTREATVPLADDLGAFERNARSGGVGQDGIPPIDDPAIGDVEEGDELMDGGDPIFGVERNGEYRAYPQHVLVWHEIANDELGGEPIAVTYCPLTGTAIGFERRTTTFGVSGQLVNSNLIMYDRATESWWPQVLGTAVRGDHTGRALEEFRVTWTTWERWRETHPETTVLTEKTGYARNYDSDPYGGYNPIEGYYEDGSPMFGVMNEDDRLPDKRVVIGARSRDGALAVEKERLRESRLVEADLDGTPYILAYDADLDTGYAYRNPDGMAFEADGEGYTGEDGGSHPAGDLPLEPTNAFDAMWFAWAAFYPDTGLHA
ncbi:MAG: DUF3179 domain-containing protein [Halalkalicoccus sp.]